MSAFLLQNDYLWVASGTQILLYDPASGELKAMFEAHSSPVTSMISVSSQQVWTASTQGEIAIWHVEVG